MRWVWLAVPLCLTVACGQSVFEPVSSERWNTVATGPLGGVLIDDDAPAQHRAVRLPGSQRQAPPWFTMLQRHGLLPANQPLPTTTETWRHVSAGRLVEPDLVASRQAGTIGESTNRLTFDFSKPAGDTTAVAWSATQSAALSSYLKTAEPEILRVWGAPAFANRVRIIHDPNLNSLQMASYDASRNELRIELLNDARSTDPTTTPLDDYDLYVLTHAVLLAYRDDAAVGFDSWEAGMARAAQLIIINSAKPSFGFLKRDFNLLFGNYDLLNQPGLEGPRFRAADTSSTADVLADALSSIRAYMCQAAWLKASAERPSLFADFNAAYYRAVKGNPALRFSIPSLRSLMASSAPQVEGLAFAEWYSRQYCLDTALVPGAKLYVFGTVAKDFISGEPTNSFPMSVYHWQTTAADEAQALTGTAKFSYLAYDGYNLNGAVEGASGKGGMETRVGEAGNAPGIGSVVPLFFNIEGDQGHQMQRIVVSGQINGMDRRLFFPNDVAASDQQVRYDLYGLVTNGRQGKLKIDIEGRDSVTADVIQGAFRTRIPGGLPTAARATLTWTPASGGYSKPDTFRRNVMYLGLLGSGIDAANGEVTLILDTLPEATTKLTKALPAGTSMVTIPAFADRANVAEVLGVPVNELRLARADGAIATAQPWRRGEIYRLYPSTPAFAPGLAYWVSSAKALNLNFDGVTADRNQPYRLWLPPGWQQVGNPYTDLLITLGSLQVQAPDGSAAVSLANAQTAGLVSSGVFGYTAGTGYSLVSASAPLTPYQGYWINVLHPKGVTLIFPNQLSPAARARAERSTGEGNLEWQVVLAATSEDATERVTSFGVAPGAEAGYSYLDVPKPPPPPDGGLSVSFPRADWGAHQGRYCRDIREPITGPTTWEVLVESDRPGRTVTLSWPGLSSVPSDLSLTITDLSSGRQRFMRSTSSLSFVASAAGNRFRVVAERSGGARLSVLDLGATISRARAGSISYSLSAPAEVSAWLSGQSGQRIRTLTEHRAAGTGQSSIEFTATDESGRPLPNGIYRLNLVAIAPDGQQARASRLVIVER